MLPRICCIYFSKPFLISPMAPTTTGIVVAFIPHVLSISISRALYYFDSFSVTLTEVFFSVGMDISMSRQLFSCFFLITMSGLLALSNNLSALAYPTRLWYCLFLLLFGAHSFLFIFISFFAIGYLNYVLCEMWLQFVLYLL